jgi:hypothetical protein
MTGVRKRRLRAVGSVLLAALLLVPVLAAGHRHASHAPCAACVVTHHTPVVQTSVVALAGPTQVVLGVDVGGASAPAAGSVRAAASRGPPARLLALGS